MASLLRELTRRCMYLPRGGGNFELFWWKKERVVQRCVKRVLLVKKTTRVFARGGGYLICSGGKRNVLFKVGWQVCFVS